MNRVGAGHLFALAMGAMLAFALFGFLDSRLVANVEPAPNRQVFATVDLRITEESAAAARGEAQARRDIRAGTLAVRGGSRSCILTPADHAFDRAYDSIMLAEIKRRHGPGFVERVAFR